MSILEEFVSTQCPICGDKKPRNYSFCGRCYYSLPLQMQQDLYHKFGEGYEEAYKAAFEWLRGRQKEKGAA